MLGWVVATCSLVSVLIVLRYHEFIHFLLFANLFSAREALHNCQVLEEEAVILISLQTFNLLKFQASSVRLNAGIQVICMQIASRFSPFYKYEYLYLCGYTYIYKKKEYFD